MASLRKKRERKRCDVKTTTQNIWRTVFTSLQYVPSYSVRPGRLQFGMGFPGICVVLKYVAAIPQKICGRS